MRWRSNPGPGVALSVIFGLSILGGPAAAEVVSASAFLEYLYKAYPNVNLDAPTPLLAAPHAWLAQPLLALWLRDRDIERKTPGEGIINYDPICDCQDDGGLREVRVTIASEDKRAAEAAVAFRLTVGSKVVRYKLVRTTRGWRIADVGSDSEPSVRALLEKRLPPEPSR